MIHYWRVVIETLTLPTGEKRTPDEAVADQYPITDWLDMLEAYNLLTHLRTVLPIHKRGLLYGHQTKSVEGRIDWEGELVKIKADVMGYHAEKNAGIAARREAAEAAVCKFLTIYSPEQHVLGQMIDRACG